jgi:tetratricopeptide (TPR) repeat protein
VINELFQTLKLTAEYGIGRLPMAATMGCADAVELLERGEATQAVKLLTSLVEKWPSEAGVYLLRAQSYLALDELERAMADIERVSSLDQRSAHALYLRGVVHKRKGELEDAVRLFKRAEELQGIARNRYELALCLQELGDDEEAADYYEFAYQLDHRRVDALSKRGALLMLHGAFPGALSDFSVCCMLQPKHAQHWVDRGNAFYELGDFDSAENDYQVALSLDDNLPEVSLNLGCIALDEGKIEVSLAHFEHALSLRPDYTRAILNRGLAHYFSNNDAAAEADLLHAAELENESCDALFALARLYARQRRYRQSSEALGKALARCPEFVEDLFEDEVFEELLKLKDVKRMIAKAREELAF